MKIKLLNKRIGSLGDLIIRYSVCFSLIKQKGGDQLSNLFKALTSKGSAV